MNFIKEHFFRELDRNGIQEIGKKERGYFCLLGIKYICLKIEVKKNT